MSGSKSVQSERPYWETVQLAEMSQAQWEALCDGCGRCCLQKLEDWDTGEIAFTNVACLLLDGDTCQCRDYGNRFETVPDCVQLKADDISQYAWLPPTCAYRLLDEGKSLRHWHPLISGDPQTVHEAGISVSGRTVSEAGLSIEDWEHHIVDWPATEKRKKITK